MKRRFLIGLTIILCLVLMATSVMAAGGSAALGTAAGTPGSIVYLTLSISDFEEADSFAVSVSGDLNLNTAACQWLREDTKIQSFDGNRGVWATDEAKDLNGPVAKLAFTVPQLAEGQTDFDYEITCTVLVKNDAQTLGTVTATGTVTLSNPATDLFLVPANLTLSLGGNETAELTVSVEPADTTDKVVWSSDDAAVASVSDGKVTAHKPGTAVITATAGSVSKSCTVTVVCSHSDMTETPAAPASCKAAGNKQYWTCDDCGTVFASDKTTVTTVAEQTIAKLDHTGGTATCTKQAVCVACEQPYGDLAQHQFGTAWTSDSAQHFHLCTVCQTEKQDAAAHSFVWKVDREATETATGLKHEECSVCGLKRRENTPIDKLTHVHIGITKHAAVAATCNAKGNVEYWTCSSPLCAGKFYGDDKCQLELTKVETAVDQNNHVGGTEVKNAVKETCGKDGYTGDTYCKGCNQKTATGKKVDATGKHTYTDDKDASCNVCGHEREVNTKIETTPMYRLYNPNSGEHFYTGSVEERDMLDAAGWNYEGVAWNAPISVGDPVYRVFNPNSGDHHFTMSWEEVQNLVAVGWIYENVAWNSAAPGNVPQYRLYNPNADVGSHHYTSSTEESDMLVAAGWILEGIGWFGMLN